MRILLATDLEATADNVAAFALAIADNFQAQLTVFHAYGLPHVSYGDATEAEREGKVLIELRKLIDRVKGPSFADVRINYVADIDYPGDGIINHVTDGKYDLLVCGVREPNDSGIQITSLGYRILRETPCHVLAVPPEATFMGVKEIVFATDFHGEDEAVLEELQTWREKMSADLFVVHIWRDEADRERARAVMTQWRERYTSRPRLYFELMEGDFESDIGAYVRQRGGDMLVLESHKKGFFERIFGTSHTESVAHHTEVPLLVMRG